MNRTAPKITGRYRRPLRLAAIALSSAAAVAIVAGLNTGKATSAASTTPIVATPWPGYADLIERVMPAVVSVTVQRAPRAAPTSGQQFGSPEGGPDSEMFERFMERFFNDRGREQFRMPQMPRAPRGMPMAAAGTGFIFEADGHIATNHHVIAGANEVTVTMADGREYGAEVVGFDRDTDLAVLKIESDEALPFVEFADSESVRVGDPVIAIGNPFGLGNTVTAGIVSAQNRVIGAGRFDDFMQIDAPINRGNSGGPTFNLEGQVIGVNTAIHSPTGGNVGIGFAIPADMAWEILADLHEDGEVERGWLGVHIQGIDEDLAKSLNMDEAAGALVAQVAPESPAAVAGVEQGDVIVAYNGEPIETVRDLTKGVADTDPGSDAKLMVWRDGEEVALDVEIGEMQVEEQVVAAVSDADDTSKLGVSLAKLTPDARESMELGDEIEGAVVTEVKPGSPAAEKGLQQGDVIIEADHKKVTEPKMVSDAVREAAERGDETILLLVKREGQDRFVAVRLERA
ncbi:MAG: Do family serine endopeptidase [Pseudomonadota bacterium]